MQSNAINATTSPSFHGFVKDPYDALLLVTAARLGCIPRFCRRLNSTERNSLICSGSVFLWTEEESSMKRWTDGVPWSPSRIHLGFLLYREMSDRGSARLRTSSRLISTGTDEVSSTGNTLEGNRSRKIVRSLAGSLFNQGELEEIVQRRASGRPRADDIFRRGGLMKKTFSVSLPGVTWHLVSYYTLEDVLTGRLQTPKESPFLEGMKVADDLHKVYAAEARRQSLGICMRSLVETLSPQPIVANGSCMIDPPESPQSSSSSLDSPSALENGYFPSRDFVAEETRNHVFDDLSAGSTPFRAVYFQNEALDPTWVESFSWKANGNVS